MTGSPLSRRQFFGVTAATAALAVGTSPAAPARVSPLAPEPPLPPGVCQRLGSARFRELTKDFKFSHDSRWLAEFHGRFLAYELTSGRRVAWRIPDGADLANDWQITTAGEVIAIRPTDEGLLVHGFHLESGHERKMPKVPADTHRAVTPDGTGLIQYGEHSGELWRTDLGTGKEVWKRKVSLHVTDEHHLTVGEKFVATRGLGAILLFDTATGKDGPKLTPPNQELAREYFAPHAFSADGTRVCGLVTVGEPYAYAVWDLSSGRPVGPGVYTLSTADTVLTADGKHLLTADSHDRLVGIDVRTGKVTRKLAAENVASLQLSPDGKVLACLTRTVFRGLGGLDGLNNQPGGIVRLLNPDTGELLPQSPDPAADVAGVRFVNPHTVVALGADPLQTSALVWDTRTNARRPTIDPNSTRFGAGIPTPLMCAGFGFNGREAELSPDGTRWVADYLSRVVVADAFTGRALHAFADLSESVEPPFWIGRGKVGRIVEGGLVVWDLTDRTRRIIPLKVPDGAVCKCVATPDGRTVAVLHWEVEATPPAATLIWVDVLSEKVTRCPGGFGELAVSADGQRVAITTDVYLSQLLLIDMQVTVIDRGGRRTKFRHRDVVEMDNPPANLSPCGRTAFFPHSKLEEAEDELRPVVQFWEVLTGELRAEYATAHVAAGLGVSPCGRRVATTHRDAPVYLWDVFGEKSDPLPKPDKTTWDALTGDADKAFAAIRQLVQHPAAAVELLSAKLTPAEQPKAEWVKARIDRLGSRDFRTRHTAEQELSAVADVIAEPLKKALDAGADSPEVEERLNRLLDRAEGMPPSAWRSVRAVEALEYCDVPAARALLNKLTGGVESAVLTREAKAAVRRRSP